MQKIGHSKSVNRFTLNAITFIFYFLILSPLSQANAPPTEKHTAPLIPVQAFSHDPVIHNAQVNFSGDRLAAITLPSINDTSQISVWATKSISTPPIQSTPPCTPTCSKPINLMWLSDRHLFVVARQLLDAKLGPRTIKTFSDVPYIFDIKKKKWHGITSDKNKWGERSTSSNRLQAYRMVSRLRGKQDAVIVSMTEDDVESLFKLDLKNYRTQRIYRGSKATQLITDVYGNMIGYHKVAGTGSEVRIETWLKELGGGEFQKHFEMFAKDRDGVLDIFAVTENEIYVTYNGDSNFQRIHKYDRTKRTLGPAIYQNERFDISGLVLGERPEDLGTIVGYTLEGASREIKYLSNELKSLQKAVDQALGYSAQHSIVSYSNDLKYVTLFSHGPTEPGQYFLLKNKKELLGLGRRFPGIDNTRLSPTEYVSYQARDGLTIPALLTQPATGKAPYPTIIMPHGGPWARDYLDWDPWVQFLADRGYLVLQPQFRGSEGWGKKLWMAGDREWGQKMQDDKDDGALWLVKRGLADAKRIAMFGYSYGGYAAMAATVRPNSPYQCAIAGAGLAELRTFDKITFENEFNRQYQNPTVAGLSPMDKAKDATIPLLLIHGNRDQIVPIEQSEKMLNELKKHNKPVEFIEIEDLWHSYPWWPQHTQYFLSNLEQYLSEKCGPGGL